MIKIGTFLQLEQIKEEKTTYKCRVIETKKDKLYIDYPIDEQTNRTDIFPVGTHLHVHFIENNSMYSFPSEIVGKAKVKNIPTLILSVEVNNLEKIQRRDFVRVEALMDVSVQSIDQKFDSFTTVTHDISGGGMAILVDKNFEVKQGEILDIMLVLPLDKKIEYVHIIGEAIRIQERKEDKNILSIKFNEMDKYDQQSIVQYCFIRQLEDRRKGLS
ncbi:c-di-GMP-binding flagellar brake protein YcgR, contains PilZNR and PilZ domains [Gracilibacillus orientalis]|uniref:C-di-GMP-binding flagellar brake protein YcgR, contains PilZNR and PilZ domains n=1 Tax=Gracilibacillus orientalis TaxID=334253 RepID=A0A1I4L0X1_9BACI|nr:flagellar brake domain-containing protein [Gracilibacillus orientalis]SFL84658.1 c-di-GMP-binding flagellar brake protein YcgR, contains PilZNR and PilZ domains [Gracilibacillus orientalis]